MEYPNLPERKLIDIPANSRASWGTCKIIIQWRNCAAHCCLTLLPKSLSTCWDCVSQKTSCQLVDHHLPGQIEAKQKTNVAMAQSPWPRTGDIWNYTSIQAYTRCILLPYEVQRGTLLCSLDTQNEQDHYSLASKLLPFRCIAYIVCQSRLHTYKQCILKTWGCASRKAKSV